ncbi:MAG: hypothetical protein RLZ07_1976 [Pseudomonadota bacterium]|jgi:GNAT superfamily N-acetyltransferase
MAEPFKDNGFYALAPGKLGVLTIYFERTAPFPEINTPLPEGLRFEKLGASDLARYRALFKAVGGPWLWVSRLKISDAELVTILSHPDVAAFALTDGHEDLGFLELDHREQDEAGLEIRYLGLVPHAMNKRLGPSLMAYAFDYARAKAITRLWLHSCHIDAPGSAGFYLAQGFKATRSAIEILDDPRVSGDLPRDSAPHVPLVE